MNEDGRRRLADAVKRDRKRKFRTVEAARIAAQVSRGTWDSVEKARPVKDFSLGAIEEVLGWEPGTAQQILDGEVGGVDQLSPEVETALKELTPTQADKMRAVLLDDRRKQLRRERGTA